MKRLALFSLNDTTDADKFAGELTRLGWNVLASSETVALLRSKGIPVTDIADFTGVRESYGFPPTLHARIERALTADVGERIDLVYVIPYPIEKGNDVGGRTLLALAVKGRRIAVMCRDDMRLVMSALSKTDAPPEQLVRALADKACFEIANHYFGMIADRDKYDIIRGQYASPLLNGENPYQIPASIFRSESADDSLALPAFHQLAGEPPCFTNMADADCILRTMCLTSEAFRLNTGDVPRICIAAKHGNACGLGVSRVTSLESIEKALFGNPRSIWGGELITNFPVDGQIAELLLESKRRRDMLGDGSWMLDLVMAPAFTHDAISVLGKRSRRKLFADSALSSPSLKTGLEYRPVRGGFLRQPPANYILNIRECQTDGRSPDVDEVSSIIVAWAVACSSSHGGNEIALAKDGALLGTGGGPSTVDAVVVAVERASDCRHELAGAAFAANAFFPFTDAPTVLIDAGVATGCVPSGGRNETDVRRVFRERGISVLYLPDKYRGFCRH